MKTYKNIYQKIYSYKNLEKAFKKARKGKSSKPYVKEFEINKTENLLQIQKELKSKEYNPKPLKKFVIRDPKTRVIRKSKFKDRIVHHALINILDPIYEKTFIHDSCANRINKGTKEALRRFDSFKRKTTKSSYILKADIKHFFNSVDHNILINILKSKIKDKKIINLINKILKNFEDKEKGMPLGNMTSQFFANLYLSNLDYFIKNKLKAKYYVRYVDDFIILHKDKEVLTNYLEEIKKYLKNLKLELHPEKSKIFLLKKGVDFLGFRLFYHHKLLRKRNIKNFKKRLTDYKDSNIPKENILESINGWFAYAKEGNTYNLRKRIINQLNTLKLTISLQNPTKSNLLSNIY